MNDELIYQQLEDMRKSLHNVENKISIKIDDHEKRISRIEGYQKGVFITLGVVIPILSFIFISHFAGV